MNTVEKKDEVKITPIKACKDLGTLHKKDIPVRLGNKAAAKVKAIKDFKKVTSTKGRDKYGFLNGSKSQQLWTALIDGAAASSLEKICAPGRVKKFISEFKKPLGAFNFSRNAQIEMKDGKLKIVKFEFPKVKEVKK